MTGKISIGDLLGPLLDRLGVEHYDAVAEVKILPTSVEVLSFVRDADGRVVVDYNSSPGGEPLVKTEQFLVDTGRPKVSA